MFFKQPKFLLIINVEEFVMVTLVQRHIDEFQSYGTSEAQVKDRLRYAAKGRSKPFCTPHTTHKNIKNISHSVAVYI